MGPQSLELAVGSPNGPFLTPTPPLGTNYLIGPPIISVRGDCVFSPEVLHTLTLGQQWAVPWTVHARDGEEEPGSADSPRPGLHGSRGLPT